MLEKILSKFKDDEQIINLQHHLSFKADSLETLALEIATSFSYQKENIAIVLPSLYDSQTLIEYLNAFLDNNSILFYPSDEVLRGETLYSSKEFLKERIHTLGTLLTSLEKHIVITNSISLLHFLNEPIRFKNEIITIKKGDKIPPLELSKRLIKNGYTKVNRVESVFEFALKGEILDIFSPSNSSPYRLEYFDEEIEDIREFNAKDELSFKETNNILIYPGLENIFTIDELNKGKNKITLELKNLVQNEISDELISKTNLFLETLESGGLNDTKTRFLPYFTDKKTCFLNYLKGFNLYYYRYEDVLSTANNYYLEAVDYFNELKRNNVALKEEFNCIKFEDALQNNLTCQKIIDEKSNLSTTNIPYPFKGMNQATELLDDLLKDKYETYTFLDNKQIETFQNICLQYSRKIDLSCSNNGYNIISNSSIPNGFIIPFYKMALVSSKEIFGVSEASKAFLKRFKEAKIITKYSDLVPGDYVVHQEQGIGRYLGIEVFQGLDYLAVEYAGPGQKLLVPLNKFNLIRKYSSKEGVKPKLDTLGGSSWARRKAKIRGRVSYLADKLIEIEAQRNALPGFAFPKEDELENEFAKAFFYKLTPSQEKAWEEIKSDMEKPHPMDRILTGDVGFGKTELAFKAAFKAILAHKQVALLCPTTVLSNQHYQVALERFKNFGVNIALLNRNVSSKETNEILKNLASGEINFIIGTHKLLSNNIKFHDLGLLIIDEEQRFGVTHKEKIKSISTNIDVLTLTATPIPRTLQMSLLNVRSLSTLDDPPVNRMPIKTYVVRYDLKLIKEVINRELGRKGQVYYLHNRVETMARKVEELEQMFPNSKVGSVNGQESGEDISSTMEKFYEGKIDILVCTSIIETGLDVPNCNTIIVEKADTFGLTQLYQIKGRVGRSSRLAYAYLTYNDYGHLNEDARKRLKALKDFTELGSGYKIATQDLNIRGAGDILGKEQAGFIDSIGYDSYMQLLAEVMKEKTVEVKAKQNLPVKLKYELSFTLDAHIPQTYASEHDRINIYRQLYDITNLNDLDIFAKRIKDVFGRFPIEVSNLFLKKQIEILLSTEDIFANFIESIDKYDLRMSPSFSNIDKIAQKLQQMMVKFANPNLSIYFLGNSFRFILNKREEYLLDLYNLVTTLIKFSK